MGRRIKDQSWIIDTKRFVGKPSALRAVEPNGDYLIMAMFDGEEIENDHNLYKINLNEKGRISIRLIEDSDEIFEESWLKEMDGLGTPRRQRYGENLWRGRLGDPEPLYSPKLPYGDEWWARLGIPYLSIDNGNYVLTQVEREGEEGEAEDGLDDIEGGRFLLVRPLKNGKPVRLGMASRVQTKLPCRRTFGTGHSSFGRHLRDNFRGEAGHQCVQRRRKTSAQSKFRKGEWTC